MPRQTAYEIRLQKAAAEKAAAEVEGKAARATKARVPRPARTRQEPVASDAHAPSSKQRHRSGTPSRPIDPRTTNLGPSGEVLFDPLLTPDQVALWLQKPKSTLYKWRSTGEGPRGIKVGSDLRYRRSDVEVFLEACEQSDPTDRRSA